MKPLDWFPKPFGPGDIDGSGARKLLGTPNVGLAELLVREMAQNSWDAGKKSTEIGFRINLRRLGPDALHCLRTKVFPECDEPSGLTALLRRDEVWALEVSDRGTSGLDGPIRNDRSIPLGEPTNFIDLVFHVGAPRDTHLGAGTYGFGKTVAYLVSTVGTVVLWSRCETPKGIEHRFIGSAIGDAFDKSGVRYTGRHWWGRTSRDGSRIEPVVGASAEQLGSAVFSTSFGENETGTSVLILDPDLRQDIEDVQNATRTHDIDAIAEAAISNLWPKLMDDQFQRTPMKISIELDGVPRILPKIEKHPTLSGFAECLSAVRRRQASRNPRKSTYPVRVEEVWCLKPQVLLGHLAMTRFPSSTKHDSSHSVAYMRNTAELVVKYAEYKELDSEGFQWAGVFKPTDAVDDSFASSEPPAHDDWVPGGISDKRQRRHVNVALKRIRELVSEYLSPPRDFGSNGSSAISVAHLGDSLSDLVAATTTGTAPQASRRKGKMRGGNRRSDPRPRPTVTATRLAPGSTIGWVRTELDVDLQNAPAEGGVVDIDLRVGIEGGSWDDDTAVKRLGWLATDRTHASVLGPERLYPNRPRTYCYESRSDVAIDIAARLSANDD